MSTLPLCCFDLPETGQQARHQLARICRSGTLHVADGIVRGLHLSPSVEAEVAYRFSALYVPRLVAPYDSNAARILEVSFTLMRNELEVHISNEMAKLDVPRLELGYSRLEALCQQYVQDALSTMGDVSAAPVWHHKLLYSWCAKQSTQRVEPSLTAADVTDAHPGLWAELQLAERCGPRLSDALTSTVRYQELLFPRGSLEAVLPVYESAVVSAFYNGCVVAALQVALGLLTSEQSIVALEVGAGTGGTASSVLPVIEKSCSAYLFTDVSEVFLRTARSRFAVYDFVEYMLLNIDADPRRQGFASQSCDFIIATNVLHATPFMRNTLRHCRQLRPGGLLVVNELLRTHAFAQITFGLTTAGGSLAKLEIQSELVRTVQCSIGSSGSHFPPVDLNRATA